VFDLYGEVTASFDALDILLSVHARYDGDLNTAHGDTRSLCKD